MKHSFYSEASLRKHAQTMVVTEAQDHVFSRAKYLGFGISILGQETRLIAYGIYTKSQQKFEVLKKL